MDYAMLVNKENPLDKDWVPSDLVVYSEYNGSKIDPKHQTLVEKNVLSAFYQMQWYALIEGKMLGYPSGFYFVIDSAYRSYDYQNRVLERNIALNGEEAYKYVALPGTSEHQSGLAIDIALYINGEYNDEFDDTFPEIKWLHANAYRFGFILRYPKGKEDITGFNYECWHLRYVGLDVAIDMHENGIETLEEYYLERKLK